MVAAAQEIRVVAPGSELELAAPAPGLAVEAALDGGVLRPLPGGRLRVPEGGDHWLAIRTRDALGRGSPVRWLRLVVDGEGPRLMLAVDPAPVEAGGREWVPAGATVHLSASDHPAGLAGARLRTGEGEIPAVGGRAEASLGGDGPVKVLAVARDRVGNRTERRLELVVDGTPPTVRLRLAGPTTTTGDGPVAGPTAAVRVEAEDAGSGVAGRELVVDGRPAGEERLGSPWAPGRHAVKVTAEDRVGNRAAASLSFVTDAAAPTIRCDAAGSAEAAAGGRTWFRPPLTVTCTAEDDAAGVAALERRDGDLWRPVAGAFQVAGGEVALRARDRVGNERGERFRWPVDGDPPELSLQGPGGGSVAAGTPLTVTEGQAVRPVAADAGCGLGRLEYRLGRGTWTGAPGAIRFRHRGGYTLWIRACDALDNCTEANWPVEVTRGGAR